PTHPTAGPPAPASGRPPAPQPHPAPPSTRSTLGPRNADPQNSASSLHKPVPSESPSSLDIPYHLRHRVLRRNRNHHVHMIRHQMPFLDSTLLLLCQPPEDLPQIPPQFFVQRLSTALRDEHHMIFALPFRMV